VIARCAFFLAPPEWLCGREGIVVFSIAAAAIALLFLFAYLIRVGRRGAGVRAAAPPGTIEALAGGLAKTRERLGLAIRRALGREPSQATIDEIEQALIEADVGVAASQAIIEDVRKAFASGRARTVDGLLGELKKDLRAKLEEKESGLREAARPPTVVLVVGVNGAGKTTSIAKLATWLKARGKKLLLCAADTFRAAAVEQLALWGERIGVPIVRGATGADPAAVAFDATEAALARGVDFLIVDTAGRLHTHQNLMAELSKIKRVIQKRIPEAPHEVILVLDATTGQNAIAQAREFTKATDVTGIFLAKLDGTAKGGIVVAIREQLGIPVKFVGLGEKPEDMQPFDAGKFVEALFAL
jgi:fused signal recognition particle receptor